MKTIDIILDNCYNHPTLMKPKMSKQDLKAPFRLVDGNIYYQTEGIAMGSPLGPTFANFYMCHIENQNKSMQISIKTNYTELYLRFLLYKVSTFR